MSFRDTQKSIQVKQFVDSRAWIQTQNFFKKSAVAFFNVNVTILQFNCVKRMSGGLENGGWHS